MVRTKIEIIPKNCQICSKDKVEAIYTRESFLRQTDIFVCNKCADKMFKRVIKDIPEVE